MLEKWRPAGGDGHLPVLSNASSSISRPPEGATAPILRPDRGWLSGRPLRREESNPGSEIKVKQASFGNLNRQNGAGKKLTRNWRPADAENARRHGPALIG